MNKLLKSMVIVAVVVIAFGTTTAVFAQSPTPQGPGTQVGNGRGGWNDRGSRGAMLDQNRLQLEDALLHDEFVAAFADALGLTVDEINTRLDEGESLMQIILSTGLDFEAARTVFEDVRTQVLEQAVVDGIISQEQADWMLSRIGGASRRLGGMYGKGQQLFGTGVCPNTQTTP
jgi:hypothetical protein